jgi:LysM repeat protein
MKRLLSPLFLGLIVLSGCGQLITPPSASGAGSPTPLQVAATLPRRATATPAPFTPLPTAPPTLTPTPIIYVVQSGDTLLGIAAKFDVNAGTVQEVNGITDPRRLQIGQELIIPRPGEDLDAPPTSTPTPLPFTIAGLSFQETPVGGLWCFGEVYNTTTTAIEQVQVLVRLFDEAGGEVASASGFIALDVLPPGERAPFAILFPRLPAQFSRYEALPLGGLALTPKARYYLELEAVDVEADRRGKTLALSGGVRNKGDADAEKVRVIVTGYDGEGRVVAMRQVSPTAPLLPRGEEAPFSADLQTVGESIVTYTVQAQGLRVNE